MLVQLLGFNDVEVDFVRVSCHEIYKYSHDFDAVIRHFSSPNDIPLKYRFEDGQIPARIVDPINRVYSLLAANYVSPEPTKVLVLSKHTDGPEFVYTGIPFGSDVFCSRARWEDRRVLVNYNQTPIPLERFPLSVTLYSVVMSDVGQERYWNTSSISKIHSGLRIFEDCDGFYKKDAGEKRASVRDRLLKMHSQIKEHLKGVPREFKHCKDLSQILKFDVKNERLTDSVGMDLRIVDNGEFLKVDELRVEEFAGYRSLRNSLVNNAPKSPGTQREAKFDEIFKSLYLHEYLNLESYFFSARRNPKDDPGNLGVESGYVVVRTSK